MGLTRADLIGEMSEEERASRQAWIDRTSANDTWAKKIFKDVGILITSHPANRPYLKYCIETHAQLGYWITLAYDNYLHPTEAEVDYNKIMPAKDVMDKIDTFIMPHYQTWGGVLYPYFWLMKFGAAAMRQFKYIYCTNGDFILERPEGFPELLALMGDADIMTCGHDEPGRYANTAGFIITSEGLHKVMQHWQDHFIPFEIYEKYTQEIGNAEGRFGKAIADCGLKIRMVDPPSDDMLKIPGIGTWYKMIGFRHIHAEHNHAYRTGTIPPHYKYLDPRFMGDEFNKIQLYWDTGNKDVLKDWWAKDG